MSYLIRKSDGRVCGIFKVIFKWRKWFLFKNVSPKRLYDSLELSEKMGIHYEFFETKDEHEKYKTHLILPEWFRI